MNPVKDREMDNHIGFLKRAEIFEALGSDHLWIVLRHGAIETYTTPGAVLFQFGDPADVLYVVKSGVVEICRAQGDNEAPSVVAYLGEGDTIGEMAITTGTPRGSLARIPQSAEIFKLPKSCFDALMQELPEFANSLITVMSRRLEDRLRKQRMAARYQKLSGDLQYFDLATVIQALSGAGRSGTLTIRDSTENMFAELYFDLGRIRYAKLGHLKGKQAVYQLFLAPLQESFIFKSGPLPVDFTDEEEIMASTTGLLMECVHLMDELRELKSEIPDERHRFKLNMKTLAWEDPDTLDLARQIHRRLQKNDTIAQMVRRLPYNEAAVYMVLAEMQHTGLIT